MSNISRRQFVNGVLATGAAMALPINRAFGANETINLGFIGLGGRGKGHIRWFGRIKGVRIAALCDPDRKRLDSTSKKHPNAKAYIDVRKLLADKDIDAVVISTSNQWHCLAAIWACQAGKDVYVEKPLGHNQFEQQQLILAARKYNRIVQVGTQQRSDPLQEKIKKFIHEDKALGKMLYVHANRYGRRKQIGKRSAPLPWPSDVDKDLWLGPSQDQPIYRNKLQYDWHWDFNTGNGEMGNWGVHILDDVRNVAIQDKCSLPLRIVGGGGRVAWNDAGDTPNVHFAYYDTGVVPVLFDLTNLPTKPGVRRSPNYLGTRSGYVIHCEGGYYAGGRAGGAAYDNDGKRITKFKGDGGRGHARNFINAVRQRNASILKTDVKVGSDSSGWCNLANVAYQVGGKYNRDDAMAINKSYKPWSNLLDDVTKHLEAHGVDIDKCKDVKLGPVLQIDPKTEKFTGPTATSAAQALLTRKFRKGFEVPEKV